MCAGAQGLRQRRAALQGQYNGNNTGFSHQYAVARTFDVAIGLLLVSVLGFIAPLRVLSTVLEHGVLLPNKQHVYRSRGT